MGKELKIFFLLAILISIPLSLNLLRRVVFKTDSAQTSVNLFFSPSQEVLPPEKTINLMMDSGSEKIAYVKVEILFDNQKVFLVDGVIPSSNFGYVIKLTTKSEANNSGRALIILGLSPFQVTSAPSGTFEIAKLPFGVANTVTSQTVQVTIGDDVQVVSIDAQEVFYNLQSATLSINAGSTTTITCNKMADANGDCRVDGVDYAVWFINFGKSVSTGAKLGDFDGNGSVNGLDYALWFLNFGHN